MSALLALREVLAGFLRHSRPELGWPLVGVPGEPPKLGALERRLVPRHFLRVHPEVLGAPVTPYTSTKTSFRRLCPFCVPQKSPHPKKTNKILNIRILHFCYHLDESDHI